MADDGINKAAHRLENVLERTPGRDHLEQPLLAVQQRFGALALVDVGEQHAPAHNAAFGISQRKTPGLNPLMGRVGRGVRVVPSRYRLTPLERLPPYGKDSRQVVWMDDAGGLPVLELLKRHAEVREEVSCSRARAGRRRSSSQWARKGHR